MPPVRRSCDTFPGLDADQLCAGGSAGQDSLRVRLTELSLPLGHRAESPRPAIVGQLRTDASELMEFKLRERFHDARAA